MNARPSPARVFGTRLGSGSPYPVREYVYGGDRPEKRSPRAGERRSTAVCGTTAGYKRHSREGTEKCQPCRDAITADFKARKAAKAREESEAAAVRDNPDDPRHGTLSFYSNQGCRCPKCKTARKDHSRKLRAGKVAA